MLSKSKKPEMSVIGGCLRGLSCYLVNFSQSVAEGSEYAQDIYKFARMAIDPKVSLSRYEVPRGIYIYMQLNTLHTHYFIYILVFLYVCNLCQYFLVGPAGLSIIAKHSAQFREYLAKDHDVCAC